MLDREEHEDDNCDDEEEEEEVEKKEEEEEKEEEERGGGGGGGGEEAVLDREQSMKRMKEDGRGNFYELVEFLIDFIFFMKFLAFLFQSRGFSQKTDQNDLF